MDVHLEPVDGQLKPLDSHLVLLGGHLDPLDGQLEGLWMEFWGFYLFTSTNIKNIVVVMISCWTNNYYLIN